MKAWHNKDVQNFIKHNRGFDKHGIFLLDQSHLVVPENDNYKNAVRMPVDEHGQLIDMSNMSEEQKKGVKYHSCYSLSELLHIGKEEQSFIIAGYQFGPGNEDELPQGKKIVNDFTEAVGKEVMKLLIIDRGYISGEFITEVKKDLKSDVLIPLRSNMDILKDSKLIAETLEKKKWKKYKEYENHGTSYTEDIIVIEDVKLWDKCEVPLHVSLMRITGSDGSVKYWGLATTFKPKNENEAFELYKLRTQIEERHRQLKSYWNINKFSSPNESLVEAHVMFTLLTYSLVQLYLNKKHLNELANKTISSLRQEELLGTNNVVVYSGEYFGIFDLSEFFEVTLFLKEEARSRLQKWIKNFKMR
ncbi:MAG: transposase, partial [Pseudomonadota bacterium]